LRESLGVRLKIVLTVLIFRTETVLTILIFPTETVLTVLIFRAEFVLQLERRGYFRVDKSYLGPESPLVLYSIPDGKAGAMSTLSTKLTHR
jgi:hypothetical protein